jgi:hypothetical protein
MARRLTESIKKKIAGKQRFKCANKPNSNILGLEDYPCVLWKLDDEHKGSFDESGYEIDHKKEFSVSGNDSEENLHALCINCHRVKTKRFLSRNKSSDIKKYVVMLDKLPIYEKQSMRSKIIDYIEHKQVLDCIGDKNRGYMAVTINGKQGYIKLLYKGKVSIEEYKDSSNNQKEPANIDLFELLCGNKKSGEESILECEMDNEPGLNQNSLNSDFLNHEESSLYDIL